MTYEELPLPRGLPLADVARAVEELAAAEGLRVGSRGTLAAYAGSIHWHLKRGTEPGTLEVTLLNRERRVHLSVHKNRAAPWAEPVLERLAASLAARLGSPAGDSAGKPGGSGEPQAEPDAERGTTGEGHTR